VDGVQTEKELIMQTHKTNAAGAPIATCDDEQACSVVSCAACLAEIPPDVAVTHEGPDYVQHFCGLSCLEAWQQDQKKSK